MVSDLWQPFFFVIFCQVFFCIVQALYTTLLRLRFLHFCSTVDHLHYRADLSSIEHSRGGGLLQKLILFLDLECSFILRSLLFLPSLATDGKTFLLFIRSV